MLFAGCAVHVYQPLSGLHDPVIVDPTAVNLPDVRLAIHCPPGDLLGQAASRTLCQQTGLLFEQQGAEVLDQEADGPPTDLTLVLRSRELHRSTNTLSWALCVLSLGIVPAVSEHSFAVDVEVRDASGFLLANDTLSGRIVDRYGPAVWAGNALLDRLFREETERLGGDAVREDLSDDLYGRLSQLVFDAAMRWDVQRQAAGEP